MRQALHEWTKNLLFFFPHDTTAKMASPGLTIEGALYCESHVLITTNELNIFKPNEQELESYIIVNVIPRKKEGV